MHCRKTRGFESRRRYFATRQHKHNTSTTVSRACDFFFLLVRAARPRQRAPKAPRARSCLRCALRCATPALRLRCACATLPALRLWPVLRLRHLGAYDCFPLRCHRLIQPRQLARPGGETWALGGECKSGRQAHPWCCRTSEANEVRGSRKKSALPTQGCVFGTQNP